MRYCYGDSVPGRASPWMSTRRRTEMKKVLITMTIAAVVLAMSSTAFANADEMHKHPRKRVHHPIHRTRVISEKVMPMDACPEEVARMMPMEHVTIVKHMSRPV